MSETLVHPKVSYCVILNRKSYHHVMDVCPPISVVIPNFNGLAHLRKLLPTLVDHTPTNAELIVVDDASTDESVVWLTRNYPLIIVIQMPVNGGFCKACNAGLEHAKGRIVVAINNDTTVSPGWVEAALPHFDDPGVGSVAPLILKMNEPDFIDSAGIAYHGCGWATDRMHGQPFNHLAERDEYNQEVFGPTMACAFYRRDALLKTGFLPVEYGAYFEDVDLAFRLRWAGYHCIHEPSSQIYHFGSATYKQVARRVTKLIARNEELVYWTNLTGGALLRGVVLHLGFQAIRLVRHAMTGRLLPFVSGKWEAMSMLKLILKRRKFARRLAGQEKVNLDLGWSLNVISRGLRWLKSRQNAK